MLGNPIELAAPAASTALARLTLIYAENGRGQNDTRKAILRSVATGDPIPINRASAARGAANPPQVVIGAVLADHRQLFSKTVRGIGTLPNTLVFPTHLRGREHLLWACRGCRSPTEATRIHRWSSGRSAEPATPTVHRAGRQNSQPYPAAARSCNSRPTLPRRNRRSMSSVRCRQIPNVQQDIDAVEARLGSRR